MKKFLLLLFLIVLSAVLGYSFSSGKQQLPSEFPKAKRPILRLALVADSENENELLAKALRQAAGEGINLVIGLGDWSQVGTVEELTAAKKVFDQSKIPYVVTAGDHDLWDSRNRGKESLSNFRQVFGKSSQEIEKDGIRIVIVDNSDIYKGILPETWQWLEHSLQDCVRGPVKDGTRGPVPTFPPTNARYEDAQSGSDKKEAVEKTTTLRVSGSPSSRATSRAEGNHSTGATPNLCFVFAHKTPFHPESKHVMGEDSADVAKQAQELLSTLQKAKVDGFFCGDLHFFAQFKDPSQTVKITTVGAVAAERNFQGPRFAIVTVYNDYSWEVKDVEIR